MTGVLLLAAALGVSALLLAVFVVLVRARLKERAGLLAEEGLDGRQVEEKKKHRPALKPWLACSAVALVLCTTLAGLWFKGCQAIGRTVTRTRDLEMCRQSLTMQADWFGPYWDKNKKLPGPDEVPVAVSGCPLGHAFVYVGHRGINLGSSRVLLVESEAHAGGTRRALVVERSFVEAKQAVAQSTGTGTSGAASTWENRMVFEVDSLSEPRYEAVREAVEAPEEDEGP